MDQTLEAGADVSSWESTCDNCGRDLRQRLTFTFKAKPALGAPEQISVLVKCIFCALRHRPMVRRSFAAAAFVGTVLTLLNQGDLLLTGQWHDAMYWKIPLTYCVPFCVATYGALTASRK